MHVLEDLIVWKKAMTLAEEVYELTLDFPIEERFGLISQMRRCAISIPSNIAEGAGRNTNKQFVNFLNISNGSAYELQTQLLLSSQLGFAAIDDANSIIAGVIEIQKMLYALIKRKT